MRSIVALLFACVVASAVNITASAQSRWQQTVQVITPVVQDDITGALLDTLIQVADRAEVKFRRSPDAADEYSIAELEDTLYEDGLDVTSANRMFITYKYEADPRRFSWEIVELYFIYRPEEYDDADSPIALVDATQPLVRNMLVANGTTLEKNEAVFLPFWDQLRLHQLESGTLVKVGTKILRDEDEAAREKERILTVIERFLY